MLEEAKKELEKLEHQNRTWNSEWMRQQSIWDEIAMNCNSYALVKCDLEKVKLWVLVMELFREKYRQDYI